MRNRACCLNLCAAPFNFYRYLLSAYDVSNSETNEQKMPAHLDDLLAMTGV